MKYCAQLLFRNRERKTEAVLRPAQGGLSPSRGREHLVDFKRSEEIYLVIRGRALVRQQTKNMVEYFLCQKKKIFLGQKGFQ